MIYKDYEIHAEIPTIEIWDVDEDGHPSEWLDDTDRMGDPNYYVDLETGGRLYGEYLDDLKVQIDLHLVEAVAA